MFKSFFTRAVVALSALFAAGFAHAEIDVSGVTTEISSASTAVATVGAAILLLYVGIKAYQWVRKALN